MQQEGGSHEYDANGLGVTSHERNEKGMKDSHHEHASYDCCNSERQRCRLQKYVTAQEGRDRRKDGDPMRGYLLTARLTIDRTPRTECRLAQEAHGRAAAVRTFDHCRDARGIKLTGLRGAGEGCMRDIDVHRELTHRRLPAVCVLSTKPAPQTRLPRCRGRSRTMRIPSRRLAQSGPQYRQAT